MFFGLDPEKIVLLVIIAAVVLGPERLPGLARQAARFVARAREWTSDAKSRVREEMGDDVDWRQLDPRQYDPRRIVREALSDGAAASRVVDATPPPFKPDGRGRPEADEQPGAEAAVRRDVGADEPGSAVDR